MYVCSTRHFLEDLYMDLMDSTENLRIKLSLKIDSYYNCCTLLSADYFNCWFTLSCLCQKFIFLPLSSQV